MKKIKVIGGPVEIRELYTTLHQSPSKCAACEAGIPIVKVIQRQVEVNGVKGVLTVRADC